MSGASTPAAPARALVVDPDTASATRLREILQRAFPGIACHVAESPIQARVMFVSARPDLVVICSSLADVDTIGPMAQRVPPACVMVCAAHIADDRIFPALLAGACGYLLKHEDPEALALEIRAIFAGGRPLSPGMARNFLRHFTSITPREALDPDEYRVLEGLASGATVHSLTSRLGLAVSDRIRRVYDKLARSGRRPGPSWNETLPATGEPRH